MEQKVMVVEGSIKKEENGVHERSGYQPVACQIINKNLFMLICHHI
jgi:hypothetical protein